MNFMHMIKKGFTTSWEYKNAITFIWFANLLFAIFIIHPFVGVISSFFSKSSIVDMFMNGNFNLIYNEFFVFNPSAKEMLRGGISLAIILYYCLSIALNGGFIGLLVRERGYKVASLLRSGFGNYKYLFLIGMLSILGTIILIIVGLLLMAVIVKIFDYKTEPAYIFTFLGIFSIFSIIYLLKEIWVDFLRIKYFRKLTEKQSIHIKIAFNTVKLHFIKLLIFGISMFIVLVLIYVISHFVNYIFDSINIFSIILSFIWLQLVVFARVYWRATFWAGEVALLEGPMGGKITEKDLWPEEEIDF